MVKYIIDPSSQYQLTNLIPNTTYKVNIQAKYSNGQLSEPSNYITFSTKTDPTPDPDPITISSISIANGSNINTIASGTSNDFPFLILTGTLADGSSIVYNSASGTLTLVSTGSGTANCSLTLIGGGGAGGNGVDSQNSEYQNGGGGAGIYQNLSLDLTLNQTYDFGIGQNQTLNNGQTGSSTTFTISDTEVLTGPPANYKTAGSGTYSGGSGGNQGSGSSPSSSNGGDSGLTSISINGISYNLGGGGSGFYNYQQDGHSTSYYAKPGNGTGGVSTTGSYSEPDASTFGAGGGGGKAALMQGETPKPPGDGGPGALFLTINSVTSS